MIWIFTKDNTKSQIYYFTDHEFETIILLSTYENIYQISLMLIQIQVQLNIISNTTTTIRIWS